MDKTSTGQHTTIQRNTGLHTTEPYLFSEDALSLESDGEASSVLPEPMEHGQTIYYLVASLAEGVDHVLNEQYRTRHYKTTQYNTKQNKTIQNNTQQNKTFTFSTRLAGHTKKGRLRTMKKNANEVVIVTPESKIQHATIRIVGDSDLILNKMNARNTRMLMATDRKAVREQPNLWEDLITSIHWQNQLPMKDTYTESDEAMMGRLLNENKPCIKAFGLKKSFGQTVVRLGIDKYSTSFDASMNIAGNGLVPVQFSGWAYREQLMSPKRGAPIVVALNHFMGWEATFTIDYLDGVYSRDKLVEIINMAGFSIGIGSGRTSGYGRYHVENVTISANLPK